MSPRDKGKSKSKPKSISATPTSLPVLQAQAAGIDIGARDIYVAVPPGRDPRPVRAFATFTEALHALRDWLQACRVATVAMESTGVYWIPLLESLLIYLLSFARQTPGVSQWLKGLANALRQLNQQTRMHWRQASLAHQL